MRLLYIATSFPEPEKGATIYTDLAEALNEAGHQIIVAVSEQSKNKKYTEMKKERGIDVLRIVTGNYYDVGFIEKGITTLKMPSIMKRGIKKFLGDQQFDFILFESPPVTNAKLVEWAKKTFNCPSYLMLKDIFPQNAVDLKIIKENGLLHRFFSAKEKKLMEIADYIGCMSNANKQYVIEHNTWMNSNKVEIFPNTKKITAIDDLGQQFMRERYGIPQNACIFLFGGNMGKPQNIDLLCEVIKECRDEKNLFFLFVGRGTERYKLEKCIEDEAINNALVIGNLPRDEYDQLTNECDVGLIVLDSRFTIPNFPSRVLSYMEYSKPVIAATDHISDFKEMIQEANCGEWVWSGDAEGFIQKIIDMSTSKHLETLGLNGRKYLEENFYVQRSVEILEGHFKR